MTNLTEAWAEVARLQKNLSIASHKQTPTIELLIERMLDHIAAGNDNVADDPEAAKRAIASAQRRERHRAGLVRVHLLAPAAAEDILIVDQDHFAPYHARHALRVMMAATSTADQPLFIQLGMGHTGPEIARSLGLTDAACRKRISRLRAEFDYLKAA